MTTFNIRYNPFNGAEIELTHAQITDQDIANLQTQLQLQGIQLIWITVPIAYSAVVPLLTAHGFVFHLCQEDKLVLIHRLIAGSYAPFSPTHTIGVGGLVQNQQGEVLLVRDNMMNGKGLKLPGGYVDLGETFEHAAVREVFEETGITTEFLSFIGLVSKYPHQFNKANAYLICSLAPTTNIIDIHDCDEIELAVWMQPNDFINDDSNPSFHRHLVKTLLNKQGLVKSDFIFDSKIKASREMFLMR